MSQAEGSYRGTVGTGTDTHTPLIGHLGNKRQQEKKAEDHPKLVWVQLTVSKATGAGGTPKEEEKTQGRVSGDTIIS